LVCISFTPPSNTPAFHLTARIYCYEVSENDFGRATGRNPCKGWEQGIEISTDNAGGDGPFEKAPTVNAYDFDRCTNTEASG
jgi:hypothetical protein